MPKDQSEYLQKRPLILHQTNKKPLTGFKIRTGYQQLNSLPWTKVYDDPTDRKALCSDEKTSK